MQPLESQAWGRLTRIDKESESHLLLVNSEWTIGRKKGCDLSFPGNKLVSGDHCKIIREKTGQVWLEDTSTNGTVINKSKVVKKQTYRLQNGDAIYVVYRKNEPDQNVAYLYKALNSEEENMGDPMGSSCITVEQIIKETSSLDSSSDQTAVTFPLCSKQVEHPSREEPQPCTSYYDPFCTSKTNSDTVEPTASAMQPCTSSTGPASTTAGPSVLTCGPSCLATFWTSCPKPPSSALAPSRTLVNIESTPGPEATKLSVSDVLAKEEDLEPTKKKQKRENDGIPDPLLLSEGQSSKIRHEEQGTSEGKQPDKMEETLTCIICQDLLHDCVSLQPCMHSFCAACYSGWMERSSLCPTCRCPVERISKNHMVNNLVEAYLLQHPEKCRSGEELQSMDARNKITHDMLQPKIKRSFSDEEVSSEDFLELSDVDSESSDISQPYIVCRQCPGYRTESNQSTFLPGQHGAACELPGFRTSDAPSTSTSTPVAVQEYTCPARGAHMICTCCFQPMPDRRAEREQNPTVTPQQCTICLRTFCHMYWGCSRVGCSGCLARFCDVNFGEKCLDGILNNNSYESDILKTYLASRGLTWKEMLQESLLALQRGTFVLTDPRVSTNTVLCYCCGLHSFRELAYQYRQNVSVAELPGSVTTRSDCYWGRNCRTQVKAHHAMKFNHICEQTRFKN